MVVEVGGKVNDIKADDHMIGEETRLFSPYY
jgi:hypothetical protein